MVEGSSANHKRGSVVEREFPLVIGLKLIVVTENRQRHEVYLPQGVNM